MNVRPFALGAALALCCCRSKATPASGTASTKPPAVQSASAVTSSGVVVKAPPVASVDFDRAPGPAPAGSVTREVRETAALALLRDPGLVRRAPLVDLEPGREFDWELRDKLAPHVAGRGPRVRMLDTRVDGDLSDVVARRIIRQNYGRVRLCYEQGLTRTPKLEGNVKVALSIEPDGTVKDVRDGGSKLADPSVTRCVLDSMTGLRFPSTGGRVKIVHTIELLPP